MNAKELNAEQLIKAQQKANKVKTYKVWVTLVDGFEKKGILYAADEEGLKILKGQFMNFRLTETQKMAIQEAKRFAEDKLAPEVEELDKKGNEWVVFYSERGIDSEPIYQSESESDACGTGNGSRNVLYVPNLDCSIGDTYFSVRY